MTKRELEFAGADTPDQGAAKAARPDGQATGGEEAIPEEEVQEITGTVARGGSGGSAAEVASPVQAGAQSNPNARPQAWRS